MVALSIVERTPTEVMGLDELIQGGIPKGNLVVLTGDPGSGKTIFCLQYLYHGAIKHGEVGVFISLEEKPEELLETAGIFGWDFKPLIKSGKIIFQTVELYDFDKLKDSIEDLVTKHEAKRLVIDPGVIFHLYFEKELDARKRILSLGKMLKKLNITSLITNENSTLHAGLYGLEEYVADGVILLYHTRVENRFVRSIGILKMRDTKITDKLRPVRITTEGVEVLPKEELFSEVL
ncbi:MAG: gas vesicle protein GvpD [Candidatus Diapherotrites archaeon]|nr:gas vesicle protein GvpD [Candidatus Diapherotrites archaeon]MDZ4256861.1 ATPase domain-containing protein [archaeon]